MYEIRRYSPLGVFLESTTAFEKLEYVRTENTIGALRLSLPMKYEYGDFGNNQIIEIWKNGVLQNETAYFLKKFEFDADKGLVILYGLDANWLLTTRIVAYAAGESESDFSSLDALDILQELSEDNLGIDCDDTDRELSSTYYGTTSLDAGSETMSKGCAWRNVYTVCREVAEAATAMGTRTYFDVVRTGIAKFQFRSYIDQRGIDHGATSDDVRLVGEAYGNFSKAKLITDYTGEENYIYAGGQGAELDREIVEVSDSDRIADGYPFNRCEGFVDARNCDTTALVTAEANAGLEEHPPKRIITGVINDTPGMKFNVHYGFGDVVSVEAFDYKVDCHIRSVKVSVDAGQNERLDVRLWGEL